MASKSAGDQANPDDVEELLDVVDKTLERLRTMYEQYFLGIQKQAPTYIHNDVERKLRDLTQMNVRNTGLRYRLATLQQKFGSYNSYWRRTLRQIEQGTYFRNLSKVGRDAVRTGADIPEEILAAMPKRMREQVVRDREQALAIARRREGVPAGEGEFELPSEETDDVIAMIKEPTELRRNLKTATGAHILEEDDGEIDLAAFFASVEEEKEVPAPPPVRAARITTPPAKPPPVKTATQPRQTGPMQAVTPPRPADGPVQTATQPRQPQPPGARQTGAIPAVTPPASASRATGAIPAVTPPRATGAIPAVTPPAPASRATGAIPAVTPSRATGAIPAVTPPVTPSRATGAIPAVTPPASASRSTGAIPAIPPVTPLRPLVPAPVVSGGPAPAPAKAPSQVTRPNPIAPGAAAAKGAVPVESMAGPFPRAQTPPTGTPIPKPAPKPSVATQPYPQAKPPAAAPMKPPPGMSDADVNALYAKYVKAKEMIGEKIGPGEHHKLLKTINAQAPKIMEQYKAKAVDFSVVVKDNQVIIRAKPKT